MLSLFAGLKFKPGFYNVFTNRGECEQQRGAQECERVR